MHFQWLPILSLLLATTTSACQSRCVCQHDDSSVHCMIDIDDTLTDWDCGDYCFKEACSGETAPGSGVKCRIHKGYCDKGADYDYCDKNGNNDCPAGDDGDCFYLKPPAIFGAMGRKGSVRAKLER